MYNILSLSVCMDVCYAFQNGWINLEELFMVVHQVNSRKILSN